MTPAGALTPSPAGASAAGGAGQAVKTEGEDRHGDAGLASTSAPTGATPASVAQQRQEAKGDADDSAMQVEGEQTGPARVKIEGERCVWSGASPHWGLAPDRGAGAAAGEAQRRWPSTAGQAHAQQQVAGSGGEIAISVSPMCVS